MTETILKRHFGGLDIGQDGYRKEEECTMGI